MVTLAKYFHDSTGIDLTLKPHRQNTADIDEASARQARSGRERQLVPTALEALYDVVVGLDRVRNYGFDRNSSVPVRLNDRELNHVVDVAQKLKMKYRESDAQYRYLGTIETMAGSYRDMLLGRRDGVSRREGRHGTRHSLIHVGNGTVYEMTNSMQETEIERFRRKTNMRIPAVEGAAPNPASSTADAKGRKVVLGKGAFGIARIARNIVTDEYVAVKKTHPVVDKRSERLKFDAAQPSNFPLLPEAKKAALRAISDAVILPSHEVKALSKAETGIPRKITNIKEAPPKEIERAESIYTFSELGISTIDDVNKILNFADIHFAGKTASDPLSVAAIKILTDYAKLNGLIGPGSTPQEQLEYGMAIFNHPSFPFKDKHQNQKFRNT
ncbi:MAG: hypothetical protein H7327_06820, partial [Herminiimonas sp.]|nr:hypothetical protein [Herminiimonas sp.]